MLSITHTYRQGLSVLLVVAMFFSAVVITSPVNKAYAGIIGSIGSTLKSVFVNVGAVATGIVGGALGAAVGGGPLGMGVGAIAGFMLGKKALNFTTASVGNFATVAGAIAGGCLCAGMGFPMLAVGVVGGGLLARLVTKGVQKLFGRRKPISVTNTALSNECAAVENAAVTEYLTNLHKKNELPEDPVSVAGSAVQDSQTAYNLYTKAYQEYAQATQRGDAEAAKKAYAEYKTNLDLYSVLIRAGK